MLGPRWSRVPPPAPRAASSASDNVPSRLGSLGARRSWAKLASRDSTSALACPSVHLCLPTAGEGWQRPGTEPGRGATGHGGGRAKAEREGGPRHAVQGWRWASAPLVSGSLSDRSQGALPVGWSNCMSLVGAKDRYFSCLHLPAKNRTLGKTEPILFVPALYGKVSTSASEGTKLSLSMTCGPPALGVASR